MKQLNKYRQHGSTLIEVLVSMFIIALGVMALMALQVRTAASIKESENMGIVAQATQNLAESMAANPKLVFDENTNPPTTTKNYENYKGNISVSSEPVKIPEFDGKKDHQKTLAQYHKDRMGYMLSEIQGLSDNVTVDITASEGVGANVITTKWSMGLEGDENESQHDYSYSYIIEDN